MYQQNCTNVQFLMYIACMKIGSPKELKNNEYRIGLNPSSVKVLIDDGHEVFIETNGGQGIGCSDKDYLHAGAKITSAEELYLLSELIIKVKEPLVEELQYINKNHVLFTYLHLAGNPSHALALAATGVTALAYETVTSNEERLPLLSPMSMIAGQLSFLVGSNYLLKNNQGLGKLLGFSSDFNSGTVTVVGAGAAGTEAIAKAVSNGAHVKIIDLSDHKLSQLESKFGSNRIEYIKSTPSAILEAVKETDLLIGAVYDVGKAAPKVITSDMIKAMRPGSVFVDISIDQGGCSETSKPTTHDNPTYVYQDVIHYCVTNMPGSVPVTSTQALNQVTLPYIRKIAAKGLNDALMDDKGLMSGLNIQDGKIVHESVIDSIGID